MKLKVLDLFAGKGAFVSALKEVGIDVEIVGFSEILPYAQNAYKAIHNVDDTINLGDVRKVKDMQLPECDMIVSGSPCQDFTREGKMKGGAKNSNTRSSLLWEQVNLAEKIKPKYIVWENVKGLIFKNNIHILNEYINDLDDIGYNTYYKLLNAHHYESAQKRERVFVVSIRKDIDEESFNFPKKSSNVVKLIDRLEPFVEELLLDEKAFDEVVKEKIDVNTYKIKNGTKLGYLIAEEGDGIDFGFLFSNTRRGRVQKESCQTIKTKKEVGVIQNDRIRYLSSLEYWRMQDFRDEDYYKAKGAGCSDNQLYALAGNSINLNVLKALFRELFNIK